MLMLIAGVVYGVGLVLSVGMAAIHLSLRGSELEAIAMTLFWPLYWPVRIIQIAHKEDEN